MTAEDPFSWWKSSATWLDPERHQNIRNGWWYCTEFKLKMHESCMTVPVFFCRFFGWFGGLFGFVVCFFLNLLAFSYIISGLVGNLLVYLWWHQAVYLEGELPLVLATECAWCRGGPWCVCVLLGTAEQDNWKIWKEILFLGMYRRQCSVCWKPQCLCGVKWEGLRRGNLVCKDTVGTIFFQTLQVLCPILFSSCFIFGKNNVC